MGEHLELCSEATLASPQAFKTGLLWSTGLTFMELNQSCFHSRAVKQILQDLELHFQDRPDPQKPPADPQTTGSKVILMVPADGREDQCSSSRCSEYQCVCVLASSQQRAICCWSLLRQRCVCVSSQLSHQTELYQLCAGDHTHTHFNMCSSTGPGASCVCVCGFRWY